MLQALRPKVAYGLARALAGDRTGVTAIEYGLIAGLVAVAIVTGLNAFGGSLGNFFTGLGGSVPAS